MDINEKWNYFVKIHLEPIMNQSYMCSYVFGILQSDDWTFSHRGHGSGTLVKLGIKNVIKSEMLKKIFTCTHCSISAIESTHYKGFYFEEDCINKQPKLSLKVWIIYYVNWFVHNLKVLNTLWRNELCCIYEWIWWKYWGIIDTTQYNWYCV